jgi:magnesium and cobalt exporter, CNNM family
MTALLIAFLILLLFSSAYFSAAETALFSLSPLTLRSYKGRGDPRLSLIAKMMSRPRDILVTILMLNVLANLLVQNTVSSLFNAFPSWLLKVGVPLALTLIFGEVLPKSVAMTNNAAVAYRTAPFISSATRILRPIRNPLTKATGWISRVLFFFFRKEKEISADELRHVLKTSQETGILLPQEVRLMSGTLDLQHSTVKERMRPREEILFYSIDEPLEKLKHLFVDLETTRVPVCEENLDHLLGILSTKRFFFHQNNILSPSDLIPILKKPYYVPESTRCWTLLSNMRERGESLAIVVDEYGAVSGLISQEDLSEAMVGEISDRRDAKSRYTRSTDDVIIASGKLELSEFREIFGIPLKTHENILTLGGWLIEQLGDIPTPGTKYANDQFLFYILAADPNRIRRVYVRRLGGGK